MQPLSMTSQQYAEDVNAKSYKEAEVYYESTLNKVFTKGVNPAIRHSLCSYWEMRPRTDLTDIAIQAESLLKIGKRSGNWQKKIKINLDWRSCIPTSRGTVALEQVTSTWIQPALLLAVCDDDIIHYWWKISTRLVRKYYTTTRHQAPHQPCLRWIRPAVRFVTTLRTSWQNARSRHTTQLALEQSQDASRNSPGQQSSFRNNRPPYNRNQRLRGREHETPLSYDRSTCVSQSDYNLAPNQNN